MHSLKLLLPLTFLSLSAFCFGNPMNPNAGEAVLEEGKSWTEIIEKHDLPGLGVVEIPNEDSVLSTLREDHPRLFLTNDRLEELKTTAENDVTLQGYVDEVIKKADRIIQQPVQTKTEGPGRLLPVSKRVVQNMFTLGLTFRWTGEQKYADYAIREMESVAAFEDWNPGHFLDTAEMLNGMAVGYDWFYDVLTPEQRNVIREAMIEKGLKQAPPTWVFSSLSNWNAVCYGGLAVGALAIAETNPEFAKKIIPEALASLPGCVAQYAPNGAYSEGVGYWSYATSYLVFAIGAMDSALGTNFGLSSMSGFQETPFFPIYMSPPSKFYFNYGDSYQVRGALPWLFWFAQKYGELLPLTDEKAILESDTSLASPFHVMWYQPAPPAEAVSEFDRDRVFLGLVPIAIFRSSWDDDAVWAVMKGGYNQAQHGHLDLGQFEVESDGVRWTRDMGRDNIIYQGVRAFGEQAFRRGGARWKIWANSSFAHNVPIINGHGQDPLGEAKLIGYSKEGDTSSMVLDLTSPYRWPAKARSVKRGMKMLPGRESVLIQDEIEVGEAGTVTFPFATDAKFTIEDNHILLEKGGKICRVEILSPAEFTITTEQCPAPNKEQLVSRDYSRFTRILINTEAEPGTPVTFAIQFNPERSEEFSPLAEVKSLDSWDLE